MATGKGRKAGEGRGSGRILGAAGLLLAGTAAGALLAQALAPARVTHGAPPPGEQARANPGGGQAHVPSTLSPARLPSSGAQPSGSAPSGAAASADTRREVAPQAEATAAVVGPEGLLRLRALVASRDFERWARADAEAVWGLAFDALLRSGQIPEALAFLRERGESLSGQHGRVQRVATALAGAGMGPAAVELLVEFLTIDEAALAQSVANTQIWGPLHFSGDQRFQMLEKLGSFSADAAVGLLERLGAGPGQPRLELMAARFLVQGARVPEAVPRLLALLGEPREGATALAMLLQHAPQAALEHLSAQLAADPYDLLSGSRLVGALLGAGDAEKAAALLDDLIARGLPEPSLSELLSEHADTMPVETLLSIVDRVEGSVDLNATLTERLAEAGAIGPATELYERVIEATLASDNTYWMPLPPDAVIAADPARAYGWARRIEDANHADDEVVGDAGDLYSALGFPAEALRMYERALLIDPTDSEWIDKVNQYRAQLGLPPR
jgi:tetratricopeptide (TPR) repeat protein